MKLIKTTFLSAISTLIKTGTVFLITKVIAITGGPVGLATTGQLQNFVNIVTLTAGGALNTAVVKYTASFDNDKKSQLGLWRTTLSLSLFVSIMLSLVMILFSERLSLLILDSYDYAYIIVIFSACLPLFVINLFFLAVLNGLKKISEFIFLSISVSMFSLLLVIVLSYFWGFDGALLSYVTNQSLVCFVSLFYIRKGRYLEGFFKGFKFEKHHAHALLSFSTITFSAVLSSNISIVFIREYLNCEFTPYSAGYWQGIWQLSQVVLSMFITTFSTYLLPKLSQAERREDILAEIIASVKLLVPGVFLCLFFMYVTRDYIIYTLYSKAFMPMSELFLWQLIGTGIKTIGWVFGYVLVSKAMVRYTVVTELIFAVSFCLLVVLFTKEYGLIGTTYAFAVNSFIHFLSMYFIFTKKVVN
ncbi:O-antigen translocase [Aeromonas hydrophila]|uniref:O-antigen translocase n=1 Tax=Aeromonas hydrophila TaxID=644 RepID=UPI00209E9C21|nr:O-antigen translocase [Aeromonas hydrophila]MCP1265089.1 O-antigen translocase [Aeromonas hydrophila]MCP1293612.1 O-antigen translocase [Aeromonas hydrophila]